MKILLNAEEFGFGPSAAVYSIFNILKNEPAIKSIDYYGTSHSIDLQKNLAYNHIYDKNDDFNSIINNYDLFITAMDFDKSKTAYNNGVKTIFYDALTWYWKDIPNNFCNYYLAQNFFDVKDIIKKVNCKNYLISPIEINNNLLNKKKENIIVFNFGGLENPYFDIKITISYIENILDIILPSLKDFKIFVFCSKKNKESLTLLDKYKNIEIINSDKNYLLQIQSISKIVFATPGLGNIFELSQLQDQDNNIVFLPPANDSQGQQLNKLLDNAFINSISWNDLFLESINFNNEQQIVLNDIKKLLNSKINENFVFNIKNINKNINLNKIYPLFKTKNTLQSSLHDILQTL